MARREPAQERNVYATIRSPAIRRPVKLEIWRYWEIVGELQWMHIGREAAHDAAKWCLRAKPGDCLTLEHEISIEIQ